MAVRQCDAAIVKMLLEAGACLGVLDLDSGSAYNQKILLAEHGLCICGLTVTEPAAILVFIIDQFFSGLNLHTLAI